mgnify:CR=1 FL=1
MGLKLALIMMVLMAAMGGLGYWYSTSKTLMIRIIYNFDSQVYKRYH